MAATVDLAEVAGPARVGHRLLGVDVARAVALIGVVAMNYTEAFNGAALSAGDAGDGPGWLRRVFDPFDGPLSTRFAATLVTLAGVGVALLARRGTDADDRWRLRRRGLLLFAVGFAFEWVWPGQILSYYGALLVLGSFLLRVPSALLLTGAAAVAALSAVTAAMRTATAHDWSWLFFVESDSPRNLVLNTVVNGTHPLVPWAAFFLVGMALGRLDLASPVVRRSLVVGGVALLAGAYAVSTVLTRALDGAWGEAAGVTIFTYRPLYVAAAVGSSTAAIAVLVSLAERRRSSPLVAALARAGQLTLTLYLLHALVANLLIDWLGYEDIGLLPALAVALAYWVAGVAVASWWRSNVGAGPAEWIYRRFGG